MPRITVNDCTYYYEDTGAGPETIVFGHGFLMTHRMWEHQIDAFRDRYRCIAIDWRGQGWSEVTNGGYGVLELREDLIQIVEQLDTGPTHYVGLSMGGFVGFWLLLRNPDWLRSAALLDTQAEAEPPASRRKYDAMLTTARLFGYTPVISRTMELLFGPAFLNNPENQNEVQRWKGIIMSNDRTGVYRAGVGIFHRPNVLPQLGAVQTPTLLLTGTNDIPTPPEKAQKAHEKLPHSELTIIPAAGHSSAIERPYAVTEALQQFIGTHTAVPTG